MDQSLVLLQLSEEHPLQSSPHWPPFIWLCSDVKDTEQKLSEGLLSGG